MKVAHQSVKSVDSINRFLDVCKDFLSFVECDVAWFDWGFFFKEDVAIHSTFYLSLGFQV